MSDGNPTGQLPAVSYAETLLAYLARFPSDIDTVREVLLDRASPPAAKRVLFAALAYRLRQLDLIPDHEPRTGLIDDCLVLRVAADLFARHKVRGLALPTLQKIARLAQDAQTVRAFLGEALYGALEVYVGRIAEARFRDQDGDAVIADEAARGRLLREIADSLRGWKVPKVEDPAAFEHEVRSYIAAKLGGPPAGDA